MRNAHAALTLLLGLALIASLVLRRNTQRDLQQQLNSLTEANGVLRQTLGDLTIAITQKGQQIDHLYSSCSAQEKTPNSFRMPVPRGVQPAKPSHRSIEAN